jgi:hypothetical protein
MRGTRYEISTSGLDPALQGVWSDPFGGVYGVGLRVAQTLPTVRTYKNRLLYMLAFARFGAHRKVRLVGVRQLLTIAALLPTGEGSQPYILEKQVTSPTWHFTDATWSWHVMRVPPGRNPKSHPSNADGVAFQYATAPALLFQTDPNEAGYKPPWAGRPIGTPVTPVLGNLHDIRFPWVDDRAPRSLDVEIEGPCDIVMFASGQQTNPDTRPLVPAAPGGGFPYGTTCLPEMDAFVGNYDLASIPTTYWRVAGSLIFEEENMIPRPRELVEDETMPWCSTGIGGGGGLVEGGLEAPPGVTTVVGGGNGATSGGARGGGGGARGGGNTVDPRGGGRKGGGR